MSGTSLRCATVHLESPTPGAPATAPRKQQLSQACLSKPVRLPVGVHGVASTCLACCSLAAPLLHEGVLPLRVCGMAAMLVLNAGIPDMIQP